MTSRQPPQRDGQALAGADGIPVPVGDRQPLDEGLELSMQELEPADTCRLYSVPNTGVETVRPQPHHAHH